LPRRPIWPPLAGEHAASVGSWLLVVLACGAAAALGYLAASVSSAVTGEGMAALAAGGLLAMLTNSLMPFAYERGGELTGLATVVGFCLSLISS
jgi:ZIP family zinc transporter